MNFDKLRREEYDHGYKVGYVKGYADGKAEGPHGKWKLVQRGECVDIVCPFCGYVREDSIVYGYTTDQVIYSIKLGVFGYDFSNFCEACGADMRGEAK